MAKASKNKADKKKEGKPVQKKQPPLKMDMSFEELLKLAATTPIKKKKDK